MKDFDIDGWLLGFIAAEHFGGSLQELCLPLCDLIGVDIEAFCKLRCCLFALEGFQCHLGFELRFVIPAWSSGHVDSPDIGQYDALAQTENPLIALFRLLGPPLYRSYHHCGLPDKSFDPSVSLPGDDCRCRSRYRASPRCPLLSMQRHVSE